MPTYEYECSKCDDVFEVFQSMTAEKVKKCPECGGKVTRLLGSGSGIIFKGSGFYQTDYRNSNYHTDATKDSSASSSNVSSKSDKKSDAKKKNKKPQKKSTVKSAKKSK